MGITPSNGGEGDDTYSNADVGEWHNLEQSTTDEVAASLQAAHPQSASKLRKVIDSFRPTAKTLIVERDYFDLDYRSEFTATHETSFATRDPTAKRLHFFADSAPPGVVSLFELTRSLADSYLGYAILRPQYPGAIGRSIISPRGSSSANSNVQLVENPLTGSRLESRIRTAVTEFVELFGVPLKAVGVPFMEQDGHLLRCAHVSAWICHFTAVQRGRVARRASAAFHQAEDETGSYGRQYPSSGISTQVLSRMLRKLDLPPEIIDLARLSDVREEFKWYDRNQFIEACESLSELEMQKAWFVENLTASVCRYLNSGIPVILADDANEHTRVVCGYIRNSGRRLDAPLVSNPKYSRAISSSGVGAFILQDDGARPFLVESVEDLVDSIYGEGEESPRGSLAVVVPLPRGLWMAGDVAEQHGASIFEQQIRERYECLEKWLSDKPEVDAAAYRAVYEELAKGMDVTSDAFAIRSYVNTGSEFKISMMLRLGGDPNVAETLCYTRMPRFVWVAELIKRTLRTADDESECVFGTVALDASVVSDGPSVDSFATPLYLHLVGQTARLSRPLGKNFPSTPLEKPLYGADENLPSGPEWLPCGMEPYETGRWRHGAPWHDKGEALFMSYKNALRSS